MLKTTMLVLALTATAFVVGSGQTVHSPLSFAFPQNQSLKVTPDPGSVWSWSKELNPRNGATVAETVLVDFDGNGNMDTENRFFRVLVTDMQASTLGAWRIVLKDSVSGVRWDLTPSLVGNANPNSVSFHLSTPLVLPPDAELTVEATGNGATRISLVGRLVNL